MTLKSKNKQKINIYNILKFLLKKNNYKILFSKIVKRLEQNYSSLTKTENRIWLEKNCRDFSIDAKKINLNLWEETLLISKEIESSSLEKLNDIEYDLGGGGYYHLLYFVTRFIKPNTIVETGVAAGFSSLSFLKALEKNNNGRLYSSDLPYFRLNNPDQYVGIIVDGKYKNRWELYLDGDEVSLDKITTKINKIDLFHYDSDKSYSGREFAINKVSSLMDNSSIIIMDDIQDNSFFHDYVYDKIVNWNVYHFEGKYIGMIGKLGT
mgnify:CR=1 FL=1|jgi:predicted O-methyltransferase YrrM